ncbi:MAG: putative membrane protein [Candidatus Paceibacteria bacterium]|jgi:uncharacterized membrane protein
MLAKMANEKIKSGLFQIGMLWRILYATLRLVIGFALLKLIDVPITDLLYKFTGSDLAENPSNFLFTTINALLEAHPISITYFLAGYLIFWGTIEIVLSVSLLKHKLWAFPVSLWLIGGFMLYIIYRYTHTNSPILIGVFCIDLIIFWLVKSEYNKMKNVVPASDLRWH